MQPNNWINVPQSWAQHRRNTRLRGRTPIWSTRRPASTHMYVRSACEWCQRARFCCLVFNKQAVGQFLMMPELLRSVGRVRVRLARASKPLSFIGSSGIRHVLAVMHFRFVRFSHRPIEVRAFRSSLKSQNICCFNVQSFWNAKHNVSNL